MITFTFEEKSMDKSLKAAKSEGLDRMVVAGGVGANRLLRAEIAERFSGDVFYPRFEFCTDNGAMIAAAGAFRLAEAEKASEIKAKARWSLDTLNPPVT
jgi:N6-L-threonylcarbamoyladenine synthase